MLSPSDSPDDYDKAMMPTTTACPHCAGELPQHLVPRNYLCGSCQGRAADLLGWTVQLFNDVETMAGVTSPAGNGAIHADGSHCCEVEKRSVAYVDGVAYDVVEGRFGGVFLTPVSSTAPPASEVNPGRSCMDLLWKVQAASLADDVRWLKDGDFLTVNYSSGDPNYAIYGQLSPEEDSFHCEVVSNQYMPADDWPLDSGYLMNAGWLPPNDETPNWFQDLAGADLAAEQILHALRFGRGCKDARRLHWRPATFPGQRED